jgi:hypothetical protein
MREHTANSVPQPDLDGSIEAAHRDLERRTAMARTLVSASLCLPGRAVNDPVDPVRMLVRCARLTAVLAGAVAVVVGWLLLVAMLAQRLLPPTAG